MFVCVLCIIVLYWWVCVIWRFLIFVLKFRVIEYARVCEVMFLNLCLYGFLCMLFVCWVKLLFLLCFWWCYLCWKMGVLVDVLCDIIDYRASFCKYFWLFLNNICVECLLEYLCIWMLLLLLFVLICDWCVLWCVVWNVLSRSFLVVLWLDFSWVVFFSVLSFEMCFWLGLWCCLGFENF